MENFEYVEPKTLKEAVRLLVKYKKGAKLLAGGTDLMVGMKDGSIRPKYLINLKKIKGLDKISYSKKKGLSIGCLVTWTNILSSKPVLQYYPILWEAASLIGGPQIRNMGTIGGNICHASPSADSAPALMVYGAQCMIAGPGKNRVIPVEEIFGGVQKISLKDGEILTGFRLPTPDPESKGCYLKFSPRRAMDLPIVGVSVLVGTSNGTFQDVKIALGAVAPTPIRAKKAERFLSGKAIDGDTIGKAAEEAMMESKPITDVRASREYRLGLVEELTYRALKLSISKNITME
jgi:CO/xanthine dehydrogenase FAD-binding subunit